MTESEKRLETVLEHVRMENAHNLRGIMGTFGESARYDDSPWDDRREGLGSVQEYYEELLTALPDLKIVIEHQLASDEQVVLEVRIQGTHLGNWRGLPPTRRKVDFPLCGIFTFDSQGKLAGERIYYDRGTVLQQIGLYRDPRSALGSLEALLAHPITITHAYLQKPWLSSSKRKAS